MATSKVSTSDPWINRSLKMRCQTCIHFVIKSRQDGVPTQVGRCRRHAPTMSGYPVVFLEDFCGDHKLDEHKT